MPRDASGFREQTHPGGLVSLHSALLDGVGVPHGFTTASGGLNIGQAEHLEPVLRAMQLDSRRVVMSKQVHGCGVTRPGERSGGADAHVTDDPQELVAVRTADCVPILLSSDQGQRVAAIHAGWRGLLAGVISESLRHFDDTASLVVAVGPCISAEHYEVGEEVASRFEQGVIRDARPKARLGLRAAVLHQLLAAGVHGDRIDVAPHCTFADAERFHSYRREGKGCGHMAAFVGPVAG